MDKKETKNRFTLTHITALISFLALVISGLSYLKQESKEDKRITEYQKLFIQRRNELCSNLPKEIVNVIYNTLLYINADSASLEDSITNFNNGFNKTAFAGYTYFSDSLLFAIESFNDNLKEIKDSVSLWKSKYAIGPNSLAYLFNKSPLSTKFQKNINLLFLAIRKESGGQELSASTMKLIHSY